MDIRVSHAGTVRQVGVADGNCPTRACFWPAQHMIRSAAGASGCSARTSDSWECGTRDARGCPPPEEIETVGGWSRRRGVWYADAAAEGGAP